MKNMNFRKFCTTSGKTVLAGKNAEQNELIVAQSKDSEVVLHTKDPGSPFCNIKGKATPKDIKETAIFCASHSQKWKKSKKKTDIEVHIFRGRDIFKDSTMKTGTFGVKRAKAVKVKKKDILEFIACKECKR